LLDTIAAVAVAVAVAVVVLSLYDNRYHPFWTVLAGWVAMSLSLSLSLSLSIPNVPTFDLWMFLDLACDRRCCLQLI